MIPPWLETFAADLVDCIELGLEGDWSATVRTVWSRDQGFLGFDGPATEHTDFRPALELYYCHVEHRARALRTRSAS